MFPDVGILYLLFYLLNSGAMNIKVHLYKNNYTPVAGSTLGNFTESTFTGYAALTGVAWPAPAINGSDEGESDGPTMTWTCTVSGTPEQAFGLYVTITGLDAADHLVYAALFSSPSTIAFAGDNVQKQIKWFDKNFVP